jgi:hypothetical protein
LHSIYEPSLAYSIVRRLALTRLNSARSDHGTVDPTSVVPLSSQDTSTASHEHIEPHITPAALVVPSPHNTLHRLCAALVLKLQHHHHELPSILAAARLKLELYAAHQTFVLFVRFDVTRQRLGHIAPSVLSHELFRPRLDALPRPR